jgi:hypothetical protein
MDEMTTNPELLVAERMEETRTPMLTTLNCATADVKADAPGKARAVVGIVKVDVVPVVTP